MEVNLEKARFVFLSCLLVWLPVGCDQDDDDDSAPEVIEGQSPGECSDAVDNDGDGLADCDDPDCAAAPECQGDDDDSGTGDDDDDCDDDDSAGDDDSAVNADCLSTITSQGIDLVQVCAGRFEMGCTAGQVGCELNEQPVHSVRVTRDVWLGATEVTQGQWTALMPSNPSKFGPEGDGPDCGLDCPVETVNWWEVLAFANAVSVAENLAECYELSDCNGNPVGSDMECLAVTVNSPTGSPYDCEGYRLPSEAEWEYAARAGTDLLYAGSDSIADVGWYSGNSNLSPSPVAGKQANAFSLFDMSGNVWEFIWDWWDESYYTTCSQTDPTGPALGIRRVARGGSWSDGGAEARVSRRYNHQAGHTHGNVGLRLARTVP